MNPRPSHPTAKRIVSWPAALPRAVRGATNAGAHGLCFHHQPLFGQELFEDHQVELTMNLLAVIARGNLILQRGEETRVLQEGEAVLVAAGELRTTEVPATAAHAADIYYCFFDDQLLRQRFTDLARVEEMANTMATATTQLYVLPDFVSHLPPLAQAAGVDFPYGFTQMLNVSFNHGWRGAWGFLRGFLTRRRSLHLYLERHRLPVVSAESIMNAYAGGPRRFRRDFRAQYDVSLERWLTWRRLDLARGRLRHDRPVPVEEVAAWVGYRNFQRFRQQFHARFGLWPEEQYCYNDYEKLSEQQKAVALTPFWQHWMPNVLSSSALSENNVPVGSNAGSGASKHTSDRKPSRWLRNDPRTSDRAPRRLRRSAMER